MPQIALEISYAMQLYTIQLLKRESWQPQRDLGEEGRSNLWVNDFLIKSFDFSQGALSVGGLLMVTGVGIGYSAFVAAVDMTVLSEIVSPLVVDDHSIDKFSYWQRILNMYYIPHVYIRSMTFI